MHSTESFQGTQEEDLTRGRSFRVVHEKLQGKISDSLLRILEMIRPVLSRVIEERVLPIQNLIIQVTTFSERIEREVGGTASGGDISLYVREVFQTTAMEIFLSSIVHKTDSDELCCRPGQRLLGLGKKTPYL
jgi:hypothetical protein